MSKAGGEVVIKALLGRAAEIDVEGLPWGPEDERVPAGIETVCAATTVRPAPGRRVEVIEVKREEGGTAREVVVGAMDSEEHDDEVMVIKDEPVD